MRLIHLFKKELAHEARDWVRDELVSDAQASAILARYGESLDEDPNKNSFGYYLLMSLGAFFLGLALILIVSHNWEEIPRVIRTSGLLLLTLSCGVIGSKLFLSGREQAGKIWLFFGGLSYGTSIMLVAQIYHLGEHFPDGIFWWAAGILPLVIFTQSRLLALLTFTLATIWAMVETGEDFFPALYPIFVVVILWLTLFKKTSRLLFVGSIAALVTWFNLALAWAVGDAGYFELFEEQLPLSIAIGILLNGLAWWLMRAKDHDWQEYGLVTHIWLLRGSIITLLVLSFEGVWQDYPMGFDWLSLLGIVTLLLFGCLSWVLSRKSGLYASTPAILMTLYFVFCFSLVGAFDNMEIITAIATNLMLVVMGILLIRRGIDQTQTHYFYTGVVTLLLTAFFRYFDLIGDYIGGAILFMVAAAILMAAAKYWKYHLKLVTQLDETQAKEGE